MIELTGLSPENPCAYLAAIGLVRVVSNFTPVKLSWAGQHASRFACAHIEGIHCIEEVAEILMRQHSAGFLPIENDVRKLKSSPSPWIGRNDYRNKHGNIISTGWRLDGVKIRKGWVDQIRDVYHAVNLESYVEALTEWTQTDLVSPLCFDPWSWQDSAKQSSDASETGTVSTAGATWLAVNALPLFPVYVGNRFTPVSAGQWPDKTHEFFTYATWSQPLGLASIKAICSSPVDLDSIPSAQTKWQAEIVQHGDRRQLLLANPV